MTDTATVKEQRRPTASLKRLATVEAMFGYIMVPFYVVLQYVFPKPREKNDRQQGAIKGFIATWVKSIGIAVSVGALLGAVEWGLAKLLNRRLLDGIPAVLTGISIPALVGGWLIDKRHRLRGAMIAAVVTLPRIVVSESWVRDKSSDEEFDQEMNIARDRLYAVLNDAS
ncbi:hypothetical protein ACG98H_11465 [Corynebacterium sp. L4756]|uniref:hypothetical protein n=1 Tax=unclassified Corynebacterium TaxID=2624378 RepID=UPI00374DEC84